MKKIFLLLFTCSLMSVATAQFEKGDQRLSLGVSPIVGFSSHPGSYLLGAQFMPAYELFLAKNLSLFAFGKSEFFYGAGSNSITTHTGLGVGTELRYYFGQKKLKPFLIAGISYDRNVYDMRWGDRSMGIVDNIRSLYCGGGLSYSFNKYISLELTVVSGNHLGTEQVSDRFMSPANDEHKINRSSFLPNINFGARIFVPLKTLGKRDGQ